MKKIIFSVLTVLFSICMLNPLMSYADDEYDDPRNDPNRGEGFSAQDAWCYADDNRYMINDMQEQINAIDSDSNEKLNNIENAVNNIDLKKDVDDYFKEKAEENAKNNEDEQHPVNSLTNSMIQAIKDMWGLIPNYLQNEDKILDSYTLNIKGLKYSAVYGIFVNVGYSLVLLFFAANLIENSIKYEIFTLKGGAMLFGRLIISKVIIDLSGTICIYILNICTNITTAIFNKSGEMLDLSIPTIGEATIGELAKSNLWLVGEILDWIMTIILIIPVLIIAIAMIAAAAIIMVKLVLRALELSLLIIVSPAFFACYSSEVTKPYFKNFIMTFTQCALQIVFMAVVYYIGTRFVVNATTPDTFSDLCMWFVNRSQVSIIALAIAIMMVKPPKVLTNLIK